jgi:hypothetical protein
MHDLGAFDSSYRTRRCLGALHHFARIEPRADWPGEGAQIREARQARGLSNNERPGYIECGSK